MRKAGELVAETVLAPFRRDDELNATFAYPRLGMFSVNWLVPFEFQLTTESVALPTVALAGLIPVRSTWIVVWLSGKLGLVVSG